jgi:hypothetical protein
MEREERKLTIETIEKICNLYNTPLTYFFGYSPEIQNTNYGVGWVPVLIAFVEKDISPEEVLSFIQVMEKLSR